MKSMTVEQKVISIILQDEEARADAFKNLTENHFNYDIQCKAIFRACRDLASKEMPIIPNTITEQLGNRDAESFILNLIIDGVLPSEINDYPELSDLLKKKLIRDETAEKLKQILSKNNNGDDITADLQQLYDNQFIAEDNSFKGAMELIPQAIERLVNGDGEAIPTRYKQIDTALSGGLKKGKLYIIAGRTGKGKSAFMTNLIGNLERENYKTLTFSYEMKGEDITTRLLQQEARLSRDQIKNSASNISEIVTKISKWNYKIDDTSNTITELENKIKKMVKKENFQCIFIDYIGLITGSNKQTFFQQVAEYTRRLKQLAMKLNVPIVALCQLNRDADNINTTDKYGQQFKVPRLSNLSDSSSVEKDADAVLMIALAEDTDETGRTTGEVMKLPNGTTPALIYIAKNRDGEQDKFIGLTYKGEQTKFYDNDDWKR